MANQWLASNKTELFQGCRGGPAFFMGLGRLLFFYPGVQILISIGANRTRDFL